MAKTSDPMTTTEQARLVIEEVAQLQGTFTDAAKREAEKEARQGRKDRLQEINSKEELRRNLAMALEALSKGLYTSQARFLMEVIQNADDNEYLKGDTPTVSITVLPAYVKIECNEVGFSKENIQALCRIGQSSKTRGHGYTGEKGLGFKSVFKLANQAHVRSKPYSFQLDRRRDLGMITPQWDETFFADHAEDYQTTIILDHIRDESRNFSAALEQDVEAIDPVLILFLRRIDRLRLKLYKSPSIQRPSVTKRFRRMGHTLDSGIVSIQDEDDRTTRNFYKQVFTTAFEGIEPMRPHATEISIVLAFPVKEKSGNYAPSMKKPNLVFAYLPLGDFGFKFTIQADFLTTTNRESVDEDCNWNKNITNAIPHAFEVAIDAFNDDFDDENSDLTKLARMWPLYLDFDTHGLSDYWRSAREQLLQHLSSAVLLKTRSKSFGVPNKLIFLDQAHNGKFHPIFGSPEDYVSEEYPESVREALSRLGVTIPDWSWVFRNIWELNRERLLQTKLHNKKWFSDLAKVILRAQGASETEKFRDLKGIPLIPLTDGTWRCSPTSDDPIYFPVSSGTTIPPGLPLSLVDEVACQIENRRKLFRLLGVKDCDIPSVIERVLHYHTSPKSAEEVHIIAQLKYLYEIRDHVRAKDMRKIWFVCSAPSEDLRLGRSMYADSAGELQHLFSGYDEARFLHESYFDGYSSDEKITLTQWLRDTARIAIAPRLQAPHPSVGLHEDFQWLLDNKSDQILAVLRQNWGVYEKKITGRTIEAIANREFICKSGSHVALHRTYLPLRPLKEKVEAFGDPESCNFLSYPSGEPEDWKFLSRFDVGLDDGLDFYLWVHSQCGFQKQESVYYSRQLYLTIQSLAYSPDEMQKVRKDIGNSSIILSDSKSERLRDCVWHGPKRLKRKPALSSTYGHALKRFFQEILEVPNATTGDALDLLRVLRKDKCTKIADVINVYEFLLAYCSTPIPDTNMCIAIPSRSESILEWTSPTRCVWDNKEFSENGLRLESKVALRIIVEHHMPTAKKFFTQSLDLEDAGIHELLADLILMQAAKRDDPNRVYRIYERISTHRNSSRKTIRRAFQNNPLVFIRSMDDESAQWLSLEDCVWERSVLRSKHALRPSLNKYRDLFRDTLEVSNATVDMLVGDLVPFMGKIIDDEDDFQYSKELLQEIARKRPKKDELEGLYGEPCWPCRTPQDSWQLCKLSKFYVNDRQNLFRLFAKSHVFLDFDFDHSKKLANLLRNLECKNFLSEQVSIGIEPCGSLVFSDDLTQDFRGRAKALAKYLKHAKCTSPYEIRPTIERAKVLMSKNIKTHYTLDNTTVTKSEGGCSVKLTIVEDQDPKLKIYVSTDKYLRECALITDFPRQLISALELEPIELLKLHGVLQVPLTSLNELMITEGITDGFDSEDSGDSNSEDNDSEDNDSEDNEAQDIQSESSGQRSHDNTLEISASGVHTDNIGSIVIDSVSVSARSEIRQTTPRVNVNNSSRSRAISPGSSPHPNRSSNASPDGPLATSRLTATSIYTTDNRNRNRRRIQSFAQHAGVTSTTPGRNGDVFDMEKLRGALEEAGPALFATSNEVSSNTNEPIQPNQNRNEEQKNRDFEVGFLGELFVYTLLHDTLELPDFTGEDHWTSSLRNRAGFSAFGHREVSDFTYKDTRGALTRHFQLMQHQYTTPEWLATACDDGNTPLYRLEVKSTTKQDQTTPFYMSVKQRTLAKSLRVRSATPSEIYVVLRISGLDALEDGAEHNPQWRVYLDPYTCERKDVLKFTAQTTFTVKPTA